MYWLTEDAFQPLMLGLLIVLASAVFGYVLKKRELFVLCFIVLLLTIGVVVTEQVIVTDKEQLTADIYSASSAMARNDKNAVLNYFDSSNEEGVGMVNHYMPLIDFDSVLVKNLIVNHEPGSSSARLEFVARIDGDATRTEFGADGAGVATVTLDYEKTSGGRWLIVGQDIDRTNINDLLRNK